MSGEALLALAERCEKASGPDRELDAAIAALQGLRIVEEGHPLGRCCYDANHRLVVLPSFTASLDAAYSLVECDEYWRLGNDGEGPDPGAFKATVTSHDGNAELFFHDAVADEPALALCAAALRARAHQETSNVG